VKPVNLPTDSLFSVSIDPNSKQLNPALSIWNAAHKCVEPNPGRIKSFKEGFDPVQSVIDNCLKFGHWDVLHHASIKVDFDNFPHDTAMQYRTHRQPSCLVQSLRYSDEHYSSCARGEIEPEQLFYFPSTASNHKQIANRAKARRSCEDYLNAINEGEDKESARRYLLAGYRQHFTISATFAQWFHILDRRLLADAQKEAQVAGWMALEELKEYSEFFVWYEQVRAGKNRLAP
jgi:flavin-dependent thymidylate synthase